MITYNNIVTKFEQFVEAHLFLKTFSHGSPSDVDLDKDETYPLLHLVYVGGGYVDNVKTYNLEVYILDNPPRDTDKTGFQKSVISATEQAAEDILADIENGGNIFTFGYQYDLQSANIVPLEDERSNILAGTLLTLSIGVAYQYDACNAPLSGVEPEGSVPQPFVTRGLLRVREVDGTPDVTSVATMVVPNGSLTDDGNGQITLQFASDDIALDDLTDVTLGNPLPVANRNVLMYLGTPFDYWANIAESTLNVNSANSANTVPWSGVSAKGSVTDLSDVTSAGSGAIITDAERTKLGEITSTGSGDIITDAERTKLAGLTPGGDSSQVLFDIRNDDGSVISAGTPVYSKGEIGGSERIKVGKANPRDPAKMPAIGIAKTTLTAGSDGEAVLVGTYNTNIGGFSGLQEGDILYVAYPSGLTATKPTGTDLIQNVGIVLKTNGTVCQGLKVACIGRTNDVPNLPDGKFFIGSATNTQTSAYGLPTSDPSDGETLVYNSANDAFEAGYPTSSGATSRFKISVSNTYSKSYPITGATQTITTKWGDFFAGSADFDSSFYRAGWNAGTNFDQTIIQLAPFAIASEYQITAKFYLSAPAGYLVIYGPDGTGIVDSIGGTTGFHIGTGSKSSLLTWQGSVITSSIWALANTLQFKLTLTAGSGNVVWYPESFTLDITHA